MAPAIPWNVKYRLQLRTKIAVTLPLVCSPSALLGMRLRSTTNHFERLRPSAKATLDKRKTNDGYQILDLEIEGGELLDDRCEHFVDAKIELQV